MTLDKEEHRAFLVEAIKNVTIPGHLIDMAYEVRAAVLQAEVTIDPATDMLLSR